MPTKAVFIVGNGKKARYIFGQYSDGNHQYDEPGNDNAVPIAILLAKSESEFISNVEEHSKKIEAEQRMTFPDPKVPETVRRYCRINTPNMNESIWKQIPFCDYIYCFFDGHTWITKGQRWFNPAIRAKKPVTLPPPEVLRKGYFVGDMSVTCGECGKNIRFAPQEVIRWANKNPKVDTNSITHFIEVKLGFKLRTRQGALCRHCSR